MSIRGIFLLLSCFTCCIAYDEEIGLLMAHLEKAVYCGETKFTDWDVGQSVARGPKVNRTQLRFVTSSNTQAAAGIGKMLEPRGCFVAIRGTFGPISSVLDAAFWLTDFEQSICPGCQVVAGFHLAYLSIKKGIFGALQDFGCQDEPLYLVGHSQGAASLSYFMFDALVKNYTVEHMYALESPRPGQGLNTFCIWGSLGPSLFVVLQSGGGRGYSVICTYVYPIARSRPPRKAMRYLDRPLGLLLAMLTHGVCRTTRTGCADLGEMSRIGIVATCQQACAVKDIVVHLPPRGREHSWDW